MKLIDLILLLFSRQKTSQTVEERIEENPSLYTGPPPPCFGQTDKILSAQRKFYSTFLKNNPSWKTPGLVELNNKLTKSPVSDSENRLCTPNPEDHGSKKPLSTAKILYLLEKYKDINISHVLLLAAAHGDLKVVASLIEKGADVNIHTVYHESPLTLAVTYHHVAVVKALIEAGADPNINTWTDTCKGNYCLPAMTANISLDQILRTLDKMSDWQSMSLEESNQYQIPRYHSTPLAQAVSHSHHDLVELLLEAGAEVDGKNWANLTPLHIATAKAPIETLKTLLAAGADVNSLTIGNISALQILTAKPSVYSILSLKILLGEGADIEHQNAEGYTALYVAAKYGNKAVEEELLARGVDKKTLPGKITVIVVF